MADPASAGPITRWTSRAWNRKAIRESGALDTAEKGYLYCGGPGSGHFVQMEQPDAVNRALLAFLAGLR